MARTNGTGGAARPLPADADLLAYLETVFADLPEALQAVASHVLDAPGQVAGASVQDVAAQSGTSPATVVRFCRTIGLTGFQALRLRLAKEEGRASAERWTVDLGPHIGPDDSVEHVAAVVAQRDVASIQRTQEQLDLAALDRAAAAVARAGRIDVYGIGGSASAAHELELRLHRIGRPVWARGEGHLAETSAALLSDSDVAIGISHSGVTGEVVLPIRRAAAQGAVTVAITNNVRSPLARTADITLTTAVYDTTFRHGGDAARHAQLLVLDCLYVRVAQLNYDAAMDGLRRTAEVPLGHAVTGSTGRQQRGDRRSS
ncbi:MurR/RpiR family transcriptional regulator [Streptomyces sporangiiformans]|uniref:MurR/RpiR family transcriptional regulator n=1 Tax=Streptomyces sporangiiformans TaxID=2315329 RepID=UPI0013C4E211|nr:MurR/RpiR family transcriptional regulator [Streptomyces sporangiiformans]